MRWVDKYLRTYLIGAQSSMEYRADFFIWTLSAVFPFIIQYFLWTTIFNNSTAEKVYGYTYSQMISYNILAILIYKFVSTDFNWEAVKDIKEGGINKFIVKPIDYFQYRAFFFLGQKSFQLIFMSIIVIVSIVLLCTYSNLIIEPLRVCLFIPAVIFALMLNFLIAFCLCTSAFWISEAWGILMLANGAMRILTGAFFPLDILGNKVLMVFNFLPFKYIAYFPVNIINGRISVDMAYQGIIIQFVWIFVLAFATNLLWKVGTKQYVAVGG